MIEHIKRIASGDLTQPIPVTSRNEIGVLAASLKHMQNELIETVSGVRQGRMPSIAAHRKSLPGTTISSRTEQQAASLEETAASMEQLTATVKQNAEKRASGQPAGAERLRNRAEGRQSGG